MSTPKAIHEALELCRLDQDAKVMEEFGRLSISAVLSDESVNAWCDICKNGCDWLSIDCVDSSSDYISFEEVQSGERHRITLRFSFCGSDPCFFTKEGWLVFLRDDEAVREAARVRLAFLDEEFETRGFAVTPWTDESCSKSSGMHDEERGVTPRKYVSSHSSSLMAPMEISSWVLVKAGNQDNDAFLLWKEVAVEKLGLSLPNELYEHEGSPFVCLSGHPPRRVGLGEFKFGEAVFEKLQEAASWVYLEGEDVEVRHTFLATELAREWSGGAPFFDSLSSRLESGLDSARLVYKAHLRTTSKETLKTLGDLRKSLADEMQKLLQQSKDLSTAVWRDMAIAIGVIALRIALYNARVDELSSAFALVYVVVAAYVAFSYCMIIKVNKEYLDVFEENRGVWRSKLYGFLDDDDYYTLAEKPWKKAVAAYRSTVRWTSVAIFSVVVFLLIGCLAELGVVSFVLVVDFIVQVKEDVLGFFVGLKEAFVSSGEPS